MRTASSILILVFLSVGFAFAGEKEELLAKKAALQQEARAIQAEFGLFQEKSQRLQERFPQVQQETQAIDKRLAEIEKQEADAKNATEAKTKK